MNELDLKHPHPDKCFPIPVPIEEAKGLDMHAYVWSMHAKPHIICPFCEQTTGLYTLTLHVRPPTFEEYLDMRTMYGDLTTM